MAAYARVPRVGPGDVCRRSGEEPDREDLEEAKRRTSHHDRKAIDSVHHGLRRRVMDHVPRLGDAQEGALRNRLVQPGRLSPPRNHAIIVARNYRDWLDEVRVAPPSRHCARDHQS